MKWFRVLCLALLAAAGPANDAAAQKTAVDVELVFLADASNSIDNAEIRFQREGYATAITDPAVIDAIAHTGRGRIAVAYVEWADAGSQDVVVDWTLIDGPAAAAGFAASGRPVSRRGQRLS